MAEYPDELWRSVADLSSLLLSEEDQETTLRRVTDLAVRCMASCDGVGVTLQRGGRATTRAATGGLIYEVDHFQYDIGEGPCLQCSIDGQIIEIVEMGGEGRWPRFCAHAVERGVHSSLSFPLAVRGETLGALNLYANRPRAFTAVDREIGSMFAAQAAVAVANSQSYAASVKLARELHQALESRAVIDQALGVLMARDGCSPAEAFSVLRVRSQHENRKLWVVAEDVVRDARTQDQTD